MSGNDLWTSLAWGPAGGNCHTVIHSGFTDYHPGPTPEGCKFPPCGEGGSIHIDLAAPDGPARFAALLHGDPIPEPAMTAPPSVPPSCRWISCGCASTPCRHPGGRVRVWDEDAARRSGESDG